MLEVNKKAEIIYGELPSILNAGTLYINDNGSVTTVINNTPKTISFEVVSDIFSNELNDNVIATTHAIATYINTKINSLRVYN